MEEKRDKAIWKLEASKYNDNDKASSIPSNASPLEQISPWQNRLHTRPSNHPAHVV